MGYSNYKNFYVFKNIIDKIDLIWIEKTGESFINKTNFFIKPRCKDNIILDEPIYGQTVMFFYQIAMIETLKYFGVESDINLGHSAGELASLYASNLINLDEGNFDISVTGQQMDMDVSKKTGFTLQEFEGYEEFYEDNDINSDEQFREEISNIDRELVKAYFKD